jgi:hypothetical protein
VDLLLLSFVDVSKRKHWMAMTVLSASLKVIKGRVWEGLVGVGPVTPVTAATAEAPDKLGGVKGSRVELIGFLAPDCVSAATDPPAFTYEPDLRKSEVRLNEGPGLWPNTDEEGTRGSDFGRPTCALSLDEREELEGDEAERDNNKIGGNDMNLSYMLCSSKYFRNSWTMDIRFWISLDIINADGVT